ncbi:MAG: hypothetical protein ACRC46_15300 [Thermoguttaceae bacterium]
MRRLVFSLMLGLVCLSLAETVCGNPLAIFRNQSVDADPNKDYRLQESNGPWLISTASFSGSSAESDAKELVLELRKKYGVAAYLHHMTFEPEMDNGAVGRPKFLKAPQHEEWAVLVGDFPTIDDPRLTKTLKTIKSAKPDCLNIKEGKGKSLNFGQWRQVVLPQVEEASVSGPMSRAMAITNPLLPKDFFTRGGTVDSFIVSINSRAEYSLLSNPGRYTVRIATFTGKTIIDQEQIKDHVAGKRDVFATSKSGMTDLDKAALAATKLCAVLRQKGYEAYIYHDRYESIVSIGAFDEVVVQMADGRSVERPEIADLRQRFTGKMVSPAPGQPLTYQPITIADVELDYEPKVIPVPRKSR